MGEVEREREKRRERVERLSVDTTRVVGGSAGDGEAEGLAVGSGNTQHLGSHHSTTVTQPS